MIASSPCSSRRPKAASGYGCKFLPARCSRCKSRPALEPPRSPSTIPPRAKLPSSSPNAKRAPLAARRSAALPRAARKATPTQALPCTSPEEVSPTAPRSSAKGSSSTHKRQTARAAVQKIFEKPQAVRRSSRIAAPFPATLPAETKFPALFDIPQPGRRTLRHAQSPRFFSTLFACLFSLAAQVPFVRSTSTGRHPVLFSGRYRLLSSACQNY